MNPREFSSLDDAVNYVKSASGMQINLTLLTHDRNMVWTSVVNILPLVVSSIGLLVNILSVILFTVSKTFLKSSLRYYIYTFVFTNFISILTHSWIYLLFYRFNISHLCKYLHYVQQALSSSSLWIMVLLSLERSLTFTRPFTMKRFLQSQRICWILILLMIFCFLLHFDEFLRADIVAFRWVNFAYGLCTFKLSTDLSADRFRLVRHALSFMLPFLLNSIFDVYICFKICQRRQRLALKLRVAPPVLTKSKKKRRQAKKTLTNDITVTLLCQSLWLLFTYFPTHLFYFLLSFKLINDHDRDNSTLNFVLRLNLLIYLAFSPTLYVILSPILRKDLSFHLRRVYKRYKANRLSVFNENPSGFRPMLKHQSLRHMVVAISMDERQFESMLVTSSMKSSSKFDCISRSSPCLIGVTMSGSLTPEYQEKFERSNTIHQ